MKRRRCPHCGEDPVVVLGALVVGTLIGGLVVSVVASLLLVPGCQSTLTTPAPSTQRSLAGTSWSSS